MRKFVHKSKMAVKSRWGKIKASFVRFMCNGALRKWLLMQLSVRTTWVQIFTFVATVTGAHLSAHNQDLIATIGVTVCTIMGVVSTGDSEPEFPTPPPEEEE